MLFNKPPHCQNAKGEDRKVGFELEFANIGMKNCTDLAAKLFDGKTSYNPSPSGHQQGEQQTDCRWSREKWFDTSY